jgi:hypothetical protein
VSAIEDMNEVVQKVVRRVSDYSGGVQNVIESVQNGFGHLWKGLEGSRNTTEDTERSRIFRKRFQKVPEGYARSGTMGHGPHGPLLGWPHQGGGVHVDYNFP